MKNNRPLSPHLFIYRFQWTMFLSILHRFTGFALYCGIFPLTYALYAYAFDDDGLGMISTFYESPIGKFMVFGWSFSLFYHLCNGIRHLLWDLGYFLDLKGAYATGVTALVASLLLTALTWFPL